MACGVPVIAADRGAVAEIAGRGAQLVQTAEDPDAFAMAAKTIIENEVHRDALVSAALERARAFRWERAARTVLEVYNYLGLHQGV
jgi:glycosyltransferase involved in cell wall biosynthesis